MKAQAVSSRHKDREVDKGEQEDKKSGKQANFYFRGLTPFLPPGLTPFLPPVSPGPAVSVDHVTGPPHHHAGLLLVRTLFLFVWLEVHPLLEIQYLAIALFVEQKFLFLTAANPIWDILYWSLRKQNQA
jgi:hypothetical protein